MRFIARSLAGTLLGVAAAAAIPSITSAMDSAPIATAERAFIDYLDARDATAFLESGAATRFADHDVAGWQRQARERRAALGVALSAVLPGALAAEDRRALEAMRRSLAALDSDDTTGDQQQACRDAARSDLDYASMRSALVECFVEHGNHMRYEGREIDRGTALQLLHVVDEPARRKAIFDAFGPLWTALNGSNDRNSPYRRMIAMAAADAAKHGSEIDAAARAIAVESAEVERWLVQALEAWRDAGPAQPVEPWDYRYVNSAANRRLQSSIPAQSLLPANQRFYRDLGADLAQLEVTFDLAPRPDKSPLAYSDFLRRGREAGAAWRRPLARVVGTYPEGGLFSLNELVHENGHAVHVSAIHTRPAYMDWPDTLFTEAFADVPAWSVHEPAWQHRYLGVAAPECESLRALYGNVMLDVAWSLFEMRLLRDPAADPNAVWTDITSRYLRIVPHPELPWWAMRVQLAGDPGYMVNYGLGAVLTAEIRERTASTIGPFDAGNSRWYEWSSERLLRFGSERDTRTLMTELLGRPISPEALLRQLRRCQAPR
jgi:hypothetical protein